MENIRNFPGKPSGAAASTLADGLEALVSPWLDPLFWLAERRGAASAWWQHVPFAHWVVCAAQPRTLVELGTHNGVSYSAFCEAVVRAKLATRCYAIDTWRGDTHAGTYGEEIFENLQRFHDDRYAAFSVLLRSTFDEVRPQFADGSVDLLHIDGLHTYEAVKHDFENWKATLSSRAVVLFHDTNVRDGNFGVWRLWAELSARFPHFEFLHGHGLGVLAVGDNVQPAIAALCHLTDPIAVAVLRSRFSDLGERWEADARESSLAQEVIRFRERADQREQELEMRARAEAHAREQIALRIDAVRHGLYEANLRAEQAEARAEQAKVRAEQAEARAEQAEHERDALLTSTAWKATWPLRKAGDYLPRGLRAILRRSAKVV